METYPEEFPENKIRGRENRNWLRRSGGILLIVVGLVLIAVYGFNLRFQMPGSEAITVAPLVGSQAPNFSLKGLDGNSIELADLRGKNVIINFWATWCGPCRIEMPHFQARHEKYPDDLVILAVNFDEPEKAVQAFVDELGLTFDIVLDPGAVVQTVYEIRAYPTTYFVDREGVIQKVRIGILTEDLLDEFLAELGL